MGAGQYSGCGRSSLMPAAAAALLAQGRTNEATRIARTYLMINPGDDDGYAVLARAGEAGTIEWLDALYARDFAGDLSSPSPLSARVDGTA